MPHSKHRHYESIIHCGETVPELHNPIEGTGLTLILPPFYKNNWRIFPASCFKLEYDYVL
jgi:hypothetical protein